MSVLTPRALRLEAHIGEIHASQSAGVSRPTLRLYEANPDHVKSVRCRWLLDTYYAGLARYLADSAARRRMAAEGDIPSADAAA